MKFSFSQETHALLREAQLAGQQVATGITALGRANHAQPGYYMQAFFGLSIGLERLAKLIVIADHAIDNSGRFPGDHDLRRIGHDIAALINVCDTLSAKHRAGLEFADRPDESIHRGIVETLSDFGKLSRYYNLDLVVQGKAASLPEPIGAWWRRVGQPILSKHYSRRQRDKDAVEAAIAMLISNSRSVLHHNEEGGSIGDIEALMRHAGVTRVVQKYGRFYTLQIVRWMAFLISDLCHTGTYVKRIEALVGLAEPFVMFMNEDKILRNRRTWSIYLC